MEVCQAERNEFAFEADAPSRCHATTARIQAQRRHDEANRHDESGGDDDGALLWGVRFKG